MLAFDRDQHRLVGPHGSLPVLAEDDITRKLAMLIEGECEALGPRQAAETFGFSKSRYYQIRKAFQLHGAKALASHKRGPKRQYRRTQEVTRQVIRHRFLDPDATAEVIAQKIRQTGLTISTRSVERVIEDFGLQKKLHRYHPQPEPPVETHRTKKRTKPEPCDPTSLERGVRQLLADKVSGTLVGLWLLVPEHLRLGTWDLLCGWTGHPTPRLEPRVALQLVHEAALCVSGVRQQRTLSQKGFEVLNGLPFVVSDMAVHQLLGAHTVEEAQQLQVTLGLLRRASGHFFGHLLALDPHRVRSYSKRQMRRHRKDKEAKPTKVAQTFFVLDADTHQPVCFTTGTASRTVAQATPALLDLAHRILKPDDHGPLVVADTEHLTTELFDDVHQRTRFDLLVPMAMRASLYKGLEAIPAEQFTRQWAGYATTQQLYTPVKSQSGPFYQLIQRLGERPEEWTFKAFLCTTDRDEAQALTRDYPKRWHIEEFFNANQALGWKRAGTQNLNIRYAQMTMALIAQTVIHQLRSHLGEPMASWDASHLAQSFFQGLDGDIRVTDDTIIVTYYDAPNVEQLRDHYENLPEKLLAQNVNPHIPWLYDFKLDFRFR